MTCSVTRRTWCRSALAGATAIAGTAQAGAASRAIDLAATPGNPRSTPPANDFVGLLQLRRRPGAQRLTKQFGAAPFDAFGVALEPLAAGIYQVTLWKHGLVHGEVRLCGVFKASKALPRVGFRCSRTEGMVLFAAGEAIASNGSAAAKGDLRLASMSRPHWPSQASQTGLEIAFFDEGPA